MDLCHRMKSRWLRRTDPALQAVSASVDRQHQADLGP